MIKYIPFFIRYAIKFYDTICYIRYNILLQMDSKVYSILSLFIVDSHSISIHYFTTNHKFKYIQIAT